MLDHHSWRELRHLPEIVLSWHAGKPNGRIDWWSDGCATITISKDLTQAERRVAICHEIRHALRGRPPIGARARQYEELAIDIEVARLLIPFEHLVSAYRWTQNWSELADELWVDRRTVITRLKYLTDDEAAMLRAVIASMEEAA